MSEFVSTAALVEATTLSASSLYRLRQDKWEAGIHYFKLGKTKCIYNLPLIRDWIVNQHAPEMHEIAIRNFLASLPSSQLPNKKPGRSRGGNPK